MYTDQFANKEIRSVILNLSKKKKLVPDGYTGIFNQTFKELNINPSQILPKNQSGGNTPKFILPGQHYSDTKDRKQHY